MALALDSTSVRIPLQRLPVAAASLDCTGVITAVNDEFVRLCGRAESAGSSRRLADIVAKTDRPRVEAALNEARSHHSSRIKVLRAKRPSIRIAIDVAWLGPDASVPYVAYLREIPSSHRLVVSPSRRFEERYRRTGRSRLEPVAVPAMPPEPCPPSLMTLSHELRSPLAAIRGWAEIAESGTLPPEKLSRALTVIRRNAASLSELIDRLFDLSRRTVGPQLLERQPLDLSPLAQLIVESMLPFARERHVILTIEPAQPILLVNGDRMRLEEVVRNLVHNAVKFTPSGGHVHVHTGGDGTFAEIVVTDTGPGIPADVLPVVFEAFRHDRSGARPAEHGLGLGLALVRELVRLHGGTVRAVSGGKGQGSTFIVRLPLATRAEPREEVAGVLQTSA